MNNYLVTGGAGFIGSKLAKKLIELNNKVVIVDNLSTGYLDNIPKGAEFIKSNLEDHKTILMLKKYNFDCIFHIAGQSSGEISFDNPLLDLNSNVKSTVALLKYCYEMDCKKFIYASTICSGVTTPPFNVAAVNKFLEFLIPFLKSVIL